MLERISTLVCRLDLSRLDFFRLAARRGDAQRRDQGAADDVPGADGLWLRGCIRACIAYSNENSCLPVAECDRPWGPGVSRSETDGTYQERALLQGGMSRVPGRKHATHTHVHMWQAKAACPDLAAPTLKVPCAFRAASMRLRCAGSSTVARR
eukprot:366294-Chlamydomonas_euryale.AAC.4